jgi:hypothetical protein
MRLSRYDLFGLLALLTTALPLSAQTPAGGSVGGQLLVDDQLVVGDLLVPPSPQTPATGSLDELVPPPAWARGDLACAPMLTAEAPKSMFRVVGSQDTVIKKMMGPPDILVISGGSAAGLQPGQRYYVRRVIESLMATSQDRSRPFSVHTAGWIQILGVDTYLATATILYACDGILQDDYLEPFTEPLIAARPLTGNTPEYQNMGRIVTGDEASQSGGAGQLMNINRGSNTGVVNGQRFLVFRDKRIEKVDTTERSDFFRAMAGRLPLVEIGEVLVVAVRPDDSTVQITVSRDAIQTGDFIAPIR